jgi:tryptophan-rich sensory protein
MVDGRSKAKLVGSMVACEAAGGIGALLSRQGLREWYSTLRKPSFTPPGSYFGPTWTLLYALMGASLWMAEERGEDGATKGASRTLFGAQLLLNVLWTYVFFGRRRLGRRTWACAIQLGGSLRGRGGRHHLPLADHRRARAQALGAQRPGGCVLARGPAYAIPVDLGLPRRLAPFGLDRGGAQASRGAPLRRPARHRAGVRSPPYTASSLYTTSLAWLPAQNASGG